jgi:uncharacterized membrane protein YbaN (DUF454 family)
MKTRDVSTQSTRQSFFVRVILLTIGSVALLIAMFGLVIPVLLTTPFVLVAAACYIRSSERLYRWLVANHVFGSIISTWQEKRGLTLRTKLITLVLVWCMLGGTAIFLVESTLIRSILIGLAVIKTIVLMKLRTV